MRYGLAAAALLMAAACANAEKVDSAVAGRGGDAGIAGDAGPAGGTGSAPDAGSPDAGPAPDGGALEDACDGLVPALSGAPIVADVANGSVNPTPICSAARPDEGTGTVPLRFATYDSSLGYSFDNAWVFYRSSDAAVLGRRQWSSGEGPVALITHSEGFTGIELSPQSGDIDLHSLAHDGTESGETPTKAQRTAVADPTGSGMVTFEVERSAAQYALRYDRFDSNAALMATAVVATGAPLGPDQDVTWVAGTTTTGATLVVFATTDGACRAVWLDREGGRMSAEFAPTRCAVQQLHPLLDGTLAVATNDLDGNAVISALARPGMARLADPPEWLAGLRLREFFLLPDGKGYALRRQGAGRPIEILAGTGETCGELRPPDLEKGPFVIGRDGTLVEQDVTGPGSPCTFRWYPQLFE